MKREQRWTPDTCANPAARDACIWIEEWDDEVDPVAREHTLVRQERACSWHSAESPQRGFDRCYEENRRKNMVLSAVQALRGGFALENYKWSLDADGLLTVDFGQHLNAAEKAQLRGVADIQFGPSKVVVR